MTAPAPAPLTYAEKAGMCPNILLALNGMIVKDYNWRNNPATTGPTGSRYKTEFHNFRKTLWPRWGTVAKLRQPLLGFFTYFAALSSHPITLEAEVRPLELDAALVSDAELTSQLDVAKQALKERQHASSAKHQKVASQSPSGHQQLSADERWANEPASPSDNRPSRTSVARLIFEGRPYTHQEAMDKLVDAAAL